MDAEPSRRQLESLQKQLIEAQENLSLIEERIAQYVQATDVPLQLIKDQRRLQRWIAREAVAALPKNWVPLRTWSSVLVATP